MPASPLLLSRPPAVQLVLVVVPTVLLGLLAGYLLTRTSTGYLIVSVVAALGGVAAGFDHLGAGQGAGRGLVGGALFGATLLLGAALAGDPATVTIPDPPGVLVAFTAGFGMVFGAIGGALRRRVQGRALAAG